MTLDWAAKVKEELLRADNILENVPVPTVGYVIESSINDEMISEFARIIRRPDIQAIGRALRGQHVYESKELEDIRKDIRALQVKLNRAKLAKNKQEIRKLEDELHITVSIFSQTKMFETLASERDNHVQIREFPFFSDSHYSSYWKCRR